MFLFKFLLVFGLSASASSAALDRPVSDLLSQDRGIGNWLMAGLMQADPGLSESSPIRNIVSERFFQRLPKYSSDYTTDTFIRGNESYPEALQRLLADMNIPVNLTENEIEEFERIPDALKFKRFKDLSIAGFHGAGTIQWRLQRNRFFFVIDFLKVYYSEMPKSPDHRFRQLVGLSQAGMDNILQYLEGPKTRMIDIDHLPLSESSLSEFATAGFSGSMTEDELKAQIAKSPLNLNKVTELLLAELQLRNAESESLTNACEELLQHLRKTSNQ